MKIKILTNCYPPEIGAAANQLYELAQALTAAGHSVSVVTRFPRHIPASLLPKTKGSWLIREKRPEASVVRVKIPQFSRRVPLLREIEHALNFILLVVACLTSDRAEVTLVYSPPIVVGYAAVMARLFNRSKVVLNVQDLFPQSLIDLGQMQNKLLIAISRWLERFLYRRVDQITVMSKSNKKIVEKTAGEPAKVTVMYNWVDTEFIRPGERDNELRREFGLGDKFVLTFAGCIADSQDMDIILGAAAELEGYDGILFLIAGNGPNSDATRERARMLKNVLVLPIQPREKYVKMLAASDVGLITLSPSVATPVVPSKMLSIMSAGRAILASLPLTGDAPGFVKRAGAGIVVPAGDQKAFNAAVTRLASDGELCARYGRQGREWVVAHYSLGVCAQKYEELFTQVVKK